MDDLGAEISRRWPRATLDAARLDVCRAADAPLELYLARAAAQREAWALDALERDVFLPVCERLARRHGRAAAEDTWVIAFRSLTPQGIRLVTRTIPNGLALR